MLISILYMFRATMCPSSGEIPDGHPHRVTDTRCRIDTVISNDDGHILARNMYRIEINVKEGIVHQVGFIYKIIQGCTVKKT
jgi:hypothetical protein